MSLSHGALIQFIQNSNLIADDDGICKGYSAMGLQAILSEELTVFADRINALNQQLEKLVKNHIKNLKDHNIDYLYQDVDPKNLILYKKKLLEKLVVKIH